MNKLIDIWKSTSSGVNKENSFIRLDWDNDRHQRVEIQELNADNVKQALIELARLIEKEQRAGYL